jgi:proteasome assembly chaperone (PAC2) family protein
MSVLQIQKLPTLTDPVLIVAFAGWNDAGNAATHAAEFLVKGLQARRFASIDPEEFYNFTEVRPHVQLREGLTREIKWPANDFFYSSIDALPRNIVIGVGIEPQLKWKTYSATILDLAQQCGVKMIITLGALLADVAYSRPIRVIGFSSDPDVAAQIQGAPSRYEGPTGIVGVFGDACRQAGMTSVSFWANVPHYISAAPNPKAALALVERLESFLKFSIETAELSTESFDFDTKVAQAVAENPNMAAYVQQLEERDQAEEGRVELETAAPKGNGGNGHANGHDMENALQRFLQQRKDDPDDEE